MDGFRPEAGVAERKQEQIMDERNEEKLEEKKEQRKIIESYDGDPDDLVFFQTEQDFERQAKQKQADSIWGKADVSSTERDMQDLANVLPTEPVQPEGKSDGQAVAGGILDSQITAGGMLDGQAVIGGVTDSQTVIGGIPGGQMNAGEVPGSQTVIGGMPGGQMNVGEMLGSQTVIGEIPDSQAVIGETAGSQAVAGEIPENRGIDPNDPHYANYEPDPYYEYGYGEEPEPIGMPGGKKGDGTGLGIASMVTGICSIVFGCCGLQYVLSLTAIILGICCLTRKNKPQNVKVFSIIGIVLGALTLAVFVFGMIFSFGYPLIFQYFGYTP